MREFCEGDETSKCAGELGASLAFPDVPQLRVGLEDTVDPW